MPVEGQFPNYDYFTTVPNTSGNSFYYLSNIDLAVMAVNESLKQTTTLGEMTSSLGLTYDTASLQIKGRVQIVIGQ